MSKNGKENLKEFEEIMNIIEEFQKSQEVIKPI